MSYEFGNWNSRQKTNIICLWAMNSLLLSDPFCVLLINATTQAFSGKELNTHIFMWVSLHFIGTPCDFHRMCYGQEMVKCCPAIENCCLQTTLSWISQHLRKVYLKLEQLLSKLLWGKIRSVVVCRNQN